MNYSPELKDALLRRMLPPNNESITKISREFKHTKDERVNLAVLTDSALQQLMRKSMIRDCVMQVLILSLKSALRFEERMR